MQTLQCQAVSNYLIAHPGYSISFTKAKEDNMLEMKVRDDKGVEVITLLGYNDIMNANSDSFYNAIDNCVIGFVNALATGSVK